MGQFLGCSSDSIFFFGPEYRPVPLKQTFVGVTAVKNHERRMKLDELAYDVALCLPLTVVIRSWSSSILGRKH